jgi:Ca2+/Na+ antiporter
VPGDSAGSARTAWAWAWARLAAGVVVPVAVVALAVGARRFVFWTLTGSSTYASASGAWLLALERALGNAGILVAAGAGLVLPAAYLAVRRRRFADSDLWLWLAASVLAVVAGFQFYGHYYLQLLPPLVLLGVAALRQLPRWWKAAAVWTALAAGVFLTWGFTVPRTELDHAHTVAAAVQQHTSANDTLLVWGMHPEHYWLADRTPATRFLTAGFLTNFSGGRGGARIGEQYAVPGAWRHFRRDLARHPADLIVDDSRGAPYGPSHIPTLAALLADHYEAVATVDGAVLYERVDR